MTRLAISGERWQTLAGKRAIVRASPASYAARVAPNELREAEAAIAVLEELLRPEVRTDDGPLLIYIVDPLAPAADQADEDPLLVRVVQPEGPGEPVAFDLTRALIQRWFGANALAADLFVEGIAGIVAARTHTGPTVSELTEAVRSQLRDGHSVSVFHDTDVARAASFIDYLLAAHGAAQLHTFLASFNAGRRDEASVAAYHRPLGELEEAWLASLRRQSSTAPSWRKFLRYLGPLVYPYRARQIELIAYMVLNMSYGLTLPLGSKFLVDNVLPTGNAGNLVDFVLLVAGVYVANAALGIRRAFVAGWITQIINAELSQRLFDHLQYLSHRFYGRAKLGDLMTRMSSDLSVIQQAVAMVLGTVIFLTLTTLVAAVTVVVLSPVLGALVLVIVPLFALSYSLLRGRLQQASLEMQTAAGASAVTVQESLSAHDVIKAFGLEERASHAYRARLQAYLRAAMQMIVRSAMFESSLMLAIMVSQTIVLGAGGYLVMQGQLSLGTLLAFIALLPTLFQPVATLSTVAGMIERASGALDRVTELLDEPVTIANRQGAHDASPLEHDIRFEGVTFGYEADRPVLRELDLVIPAGKHLAIVGPSGSGKSSLVSLLLRFWDPDEGRIVVDGSDLRDLTLDSHRRQIALVFQDTFVFDTTLRENIAIGRAGASDAEILEAARAARLEDYIGSLPAGFDTVLGERGVRMSGGQRQRLAIARALLRDPRVLILDEATSALDAQTESEILETLMEVGRGRTILTVTHRLSLAAVADLIVVLESGRIVERGPHTALASAGGLYQRLWEEQSHVRALGGAAARFDADRVRAVPLFASLSAADLAVLASRLSLERFAMGEEVVREGEPGDRLYVIARGELEVLRGGPNGRRINVLGAGDYFGEIALLLGGARTATVRTTEATELFGLDRGDFLELMRTQPALASAVDAVIAQRRGVGAFEDDMRDTSVPSGSTR